MKDAELVALEQLQQRWCHEDALCSLPEGVQEPPIIHWTAMHPVPLPQWRTTIACQGFRIRSSMTILISRALSAQHLPP